MSEERILELVSKKVLGVITPKEQLELSALLGEHPEEQQQVGVLYEYMAAGYHNDEAVKQRKAEESWSRVLEKTTVAQQGSPFTDTVLPVTKKRRWYAVGVAASVLIVAGALIWFMAGRPAGTGKAANIVATNKGSKSMVVLPDHSKVWINSDTRLNYDESFGKGLREVTLEGEAYFEVEKNKDLPFIVHTSNMDIKVLGTAFNVRSYANEANAQTTLVRGSVQIKLLNKEAGKKIMLRPNEKAIVRNAAYHAVDAADTAEVTVVAVNRNGADSLIYETQWVSNRLAFENERLEHMLPVLERWYNITIIMKRKAPVQRTFSGVFDNDSIDDVLKTLKLTMGFDYRKDNSLVYIF
ncbi:FecR domain-containing protein [Niabella aurantiaca]|uniref:FecR domain-containing protein n=1 Tax=Niabella aurantiaca TaxID=379900 RepID=UPI000361C33B|nr:FecR domain-containing protein [Niabella aurantiaca]